MRLPGTWWTMRIVALAAAVLAMQQGPARTASTQATEPTSGWEAVHALMGNTLVLTWPTFTSAIYFLPDGTGFSARQVGEARGEPGPIRWGVQSDDKVCVTAAGQAFSDENCTHMAMTGDRVALILDEQTRLPGRVAQGDAWGLEAGVDTITGKAAAEALIGNTLALTILGSSEASLIFRFQADGTGQIFDHLDNSDTPKSLQWSLRDDGGLCWKADEDTPDESRCFAVAITGERVTLTFQEQLQGRRQFGKLLKGDVRHLSPEAVAAQEPIATLLVGNTLVFKPINDSGEERASYTYIEANGAGRSARSNGGVVSDAKPVQWVLRGADTLCIAPIGGKSDDGQCASISLDDDNVILTPDDGSQWSGKLLPGNPWNL